MDNITYIDCIVCNKPMPELRLTKFGYKNCVNCSTTKPKQAVNAQFGEGDHTFNDIVFVED
jgi:RNA polymerase-binding transcription factor DksA